MKSVANHTYYVVADLIPHRIDHRSDYAALVHIGDASFLPVEGRQRVILGGVGGSSFPGEDEYQVDAVGRYLMRAGQWDGLEGRVYASAHRDGEARAEHSFEVLRVVDESGANVPARVCSALL